MEQTQFFFWFFFGIVVLIISTQTVTTWYVFDNFSQLKKGSGIRTFQSIAFCGIISFIIIGSAFIGKTGIAVGGAILEVLINFFYYAQEFFDKGFKLTKGHTKTKIKARHNSILIFWRKYWLKMIFGLAVPAGIYICSELMVELSK